MFNELRKENVIVDLEVLVKSAQNYEEDMNTYLEFTKQRILSVSGNN